MARPPQGTKNSKTRGGIAMRACHWVSNCSGLTELSGALNHRVVSERPRSKWSRHISTSTSIVRLALGSCQCWTRKGSFERIKTSISDGETEDMLNILEKLDCFDRFLLLI